MVMNIAIQQQGWSTHQEVDFSNAFVQAKRAEDVYIEAPTMFTNANHNDKETVLLKLNKFLYGLV